MNNSKKSRQDEVNEFLEALKKGFNDASKIKIEIKAEDGKVFDLNEMFGEPMFKAFIDDLTNECELELQTLGE